MVSSETHPEAPAGGSTPLPPTTDKRYATRGGATPGEQSHANVPAISISYARVASSRLEGTFVNRKGVDEPAAELGGVVGTGT